MNKIILINNIIIIIYIVNLYLYINPYFIILHFYNKNYQFLLLKINNILYFQILLPLFGQIDYTVEGQEESYVDYTIWLVDLTYHVTVNNHHHHTHSEKLISLICELIMSSQGIQDQMIQNKGFLVISYYLEKVAPLFTCFSISRISHSITFQLSYFLILYF